MRDLKIGDELRLTGVEWEADHGLGPNLVVKVERFDDRQAWNDSVPGVGSLTNVDGTPLGGGYEVELIEQPTEPAKPTVQGYTLSLYVSKSAAAEFPGETQELASITIAHDELARLLDQGRSFLEVLADG
ncbi:hypothetical protein QDW42_gp64 [Microbacterium phage Swervy]|uniref:hypothetical protein n=1 Tax=Microbacterium phage Swervy TaxID=2867473 RepID=UPI001E7D18FF|nr:hypothetical protein QDW42_gp64 [Microbacterium phage Swervy]UAW08651.1 hypothetical protein Swervy_64 [Microbacterium phage Swervy]